MKNTGYFAVVCGSSLFLFVSLWCCTISVYAATCPAGKKYAIIQYDHTLRNVSTQQGSTFAQITTLSGGVGIQIKKQSVTNAGNDKINKEIEPLWSTPGCYCDAVQDPAQSLVTVKISGTCTSGKLTMHVHEENPESYATLECTGGHCSSNIIFQPYPSATSDYDLTIPFVNGAIVTQPYICPNCSGNYSWKIIFTNKPPPMIHTAFSLVPLISPLILNH